MDSVHIGFFLLNIIPLVFRLPSNKKEKKTSDNVKKMK